MRHGSQLKITLLRVDFQRLSQIIANLTRENLAEREAEITNLPWTQRERQCFGQMQNWTNVHGVTKNQCFLSVLSLMKRAIPLKTKMNLEEDFVSIGEPFSKHVVKAPDINSTEISYDTVKRLLTTSAGPLIRPNLTNSLL